jgi:hypothetical protein
MLVAFSFCTESHSNVRMTRSTYFEEFVEFGKPAALWARAKARSRVEARVFVGL